MMFNYSPIITALSLINRPSLKKVEARRIHKSKLDTENSYRRNEAPLTEKLPESTFNYPKGPVPFHIFKLLTQEVKPFPRTVILPQDELRLTF